MCRFQSGARLPAVPEANRCPESNSDAKWVQHQDHCYAFDMSLYRYNTYSFQQARDICQRIGELFGGSHIIVGVYLKHSQSNNCCFPFVLTDAQLLSIKSKEENDFVSEYMSDDPLITSRVWLDLEFNAEGKPANIVSCLQCSCRVWCLTFCISVSAQTSKLLTFLK